MRVGRAGYGRGTLLGFSISVLAALIGEPALGLDRERTLKELYHTAWRAKEGAPSQISALAQTTDGYLWIGSARGLFRFDGVQFEEYIPPPGVSLPSHNIYALTATPDGGLWISFRPSGLGHLANGRMTVWTKAEELPHSSIYELAGDLDGRVWAGTQEGLSLQDGSHWVDIGRDWNFTPARIWTLFVDRTGTLWAASDRGISFLRRGAHKFEQTGEPPSIVQSMAQALDGRLWIAGESGARPLGIGAHPPGGSPSIRGRLLFDRDGSLWAAGVEDGVQRVRYPESLGHRNIEAGDAGLETFLERDGLSGDSAITILEDREGNIWVATIRGLDRFRLSPVVPVPLPPGHRNLTLLGGEDGDIWVGSAADRPLLRIHGRETTAVKGIQEISSVYRDQHRVVWWAGVRGVWRQEGERLDLFREPVSGKPEWIWEIFRNGVGEGLWIGLGDEGLFQFNEGVWTKPTLAELPDKVPSATYEDPSGRIWLGYAANRVNVIEGGKVTSFSPEDGLDIGRIRVIRGRGSALWFGGELGLSMFQGARFRRVLGADGKEFGTVSGIVERADGSLWLNEMRGIVFIPADEVQKAVRDPNHGVAFRVFDFLDGLPGAGQMNWTCSTAIEASDGRLWFATDNGLARIDPERIAKNRIPPPVSIRSAHADARDYSPSNSLRLPPGTANLRIDYTALSLSIPERVRFRYRLDGLDADWRDAGSRRSAFYTNPKPGQYRFRVIASNDDGVWNETGASLDLFLAPSFYQTNGFLVLCVAVAGGITWMTYRVHVRQVMARMDMRFQERLSERTRIAGELHDTLLQGFQGLMLHFQRVRELLPVRADEAAQTLDAALDRADKALAEGRDAIQGIRSSSVGDHDLVQAIQACGEEFAKDDLAHTVTFQVEVEGSSRVLRPSFREELYGIAREALRNAFSHADARRIEVAITYGDDALHLRIRDDGKGIDPSILERGELTNHWGLIGMRERAGRIGVRLDIWSRKGAGTEVDVKVPSNVVYVGPKARFGPWFFRGRDGA